MRPKMEELENNCPNDSINTKILIEALLGLAKFGLLCDLTPTCSHRWSNGQWLEYLRSAGSIVQSWAEEVLVSAGYKEPKCSCGKKPFFTLNHDFVCRCGKRYNIDGTEKKRF